MIVASVLTTNLAILVLAGFVGFIVISKIPNTLHTPLMSGTNAIHGIVLLGALILIGLPASGLVTLDPFSKVLLVIAVAFGTINVIGGFLVTDRMLEMFKSKPTARPPATDVAAPATEVAAPATEVLPPASEVLPPTTEGGPAPGQARESARSEDEADPGAGAGEGEQGQVQ